MDRFRVVDQFVFSVVLREIAERDATPGIDFIDADVSRFDLSSCTVFVRMVLNQTNRNPLATKNVRCTVR